MLIVAAAMRGTEIAGASGWPTSFYIALAITLFAWNPSAVWPLHQVCSERVSDNQSPAPVHLGRVLTVELGFRIAERPMSFHDDCSLFGPKFPSVGKVGFANCHVEQDHQQACRCQNGSPPHRG